MAKKKKSPLSALFWSIGSLISSLLLLAFGWVLYSRRYIDHSVAIGDMLDAERNEYNSPHAGRLSYYVDKFGKGKPVLILHGIHPVAGVHEVSPLFYGLRNNRPVYVLDLPGFGHSERGPRAYCSELYQAAIQEFIQNVIGEATDVIAYSLTCEFAAEVAVKHPELISSLVMISPLGFSLSHQTKIQERAEASKFQNLVYALMAVPLWSRAIFDVFASRPKIASFYEKRFMHTFPSNFIETAYASAHQPGAHLAPIYYLSGKLSNRYVRKQVYEQVKVPVLVLFDQDPGTNFEMLSLAVREKSNWKAVRIRPSRGLPHFDRPGETFFAMDDFWKSVK